MVLYYKIEKVMIFCLYYFSVLQYFFVLSIYRMKGGLIMRIVVGITGASGAIYGIKLLEELKAQKVESHLIISKWAERTIVEETSFSIEDVYRLAGIVYEENDLGAAISSGSFRHHGMVIAPCSMKTLAAIAQGFDYNLIARAAGVTIKEQRKLVLLVRETPLSTIHLRNMLELAKLGVIINPPIPSFYNKPQNVEQIVNQSVGRVLDHFGIKNSLVNRWGE
jgi:4-hydroxy-3-polyprenylbenzoate decarboxylase